MRIAPEELHGVFSYHQVVLRAQVHRHGRGVKQRPVGPLLDALGARAFESLAAANVGLWGALAWRYASKNRRLLRDDVTDLQAKQLAVRITGEPLTAAVTFPVAFVGPIFWELSWFAYPVIAGIVRRRAKAMKARS